MAYSNSRDEAEPGRNKAGANQVHPKDMPRNPPWHDRGNVLGDGEVFGAESCNGHRVEERPEENELIEFWFSSPFATNENRDETDGKNRSADAIRPSDLDGNCGPRDGSRRSR